MIICLLLPTHPRDPRPTLCAKRNRPRRLERLEEFIGLEKCLDAQRIEDAKCDQKEQYILRSRGVLDSLYRTSAEDLRIVQTRRALLTKLGRVLRQCRRRRWRGGHRRALYL